MKTCNNCGKQFKINVIIDGEKKNLCHRKFCLDCSPFKCHNTSKIPPVRFDQRPKKIAKTNGVPWNKGKPMSENQKEKIRSALKGRPGKKHSKETISKLSIKRKEFLRENPHLHPNRLLANNRVSCSFPEKLVMDYLTTHNIPFKHQENIDRYWVDFLIDQRLVLEVDGSRWHNKAQDSVRDKTLAGLGFEVIRISAKSVVSDINGALDSLVVRLLWEQEVESSNLSAPN